MHILEGKIVEEKVARVKEGRVGREWVWLLLSLSPRFQPWNPHSGRKETTWTSCSPAFVLCH